MWIQVDKESKIKDGIWVACIAEIRLNSTGEVRECEVNEVLRDGALYPASFNWEENNFACDCNRRILFKQAKDELKEEDWDIKCSDGIFSVNLKNKLDGKVYYREFEKK